MQIGNAAGGAEKQTAAIGNAAAAGTGNAAGGYGAWNGAEAVSRKATVSSAGAGSRAGNGVLQGVLVDVGDYVFIGKSDESKPDRASCHKVLGFSQNLRGVNPHIRIEAK